MRRPDQNHRGRNAVAMTIAALAALLMLPAGSHALQSCTTSITTLCDSTRADYATSDCDGDGYTDQQECQGFTLPGGTHICGYNETTCTNNMDPSKPDLLYLLTDTTLIKDITDATTPLPGGKTSLIFPAMANLPNGALNVYASSVFANSLKIKMHRILYADTSSDRTVFAGTPPTKAARIVEDATPTLNPTCTKSCNPSDTALGMTKEGRTSDPGIASTIYSYRIKDNVTKNCTTVDGTCSVKGTLPLITKFNDIVNYYILQVIAHEMGHGSGLAIANTDALYHYSKSGTVMDPSVTFSQKVYTIPTNFDPVKDSPVIYLK